MEVAVHKTVIRQVPVQTAAAHKVVGSRDGNLHRSIQSEKVLHTNETLKSPYLTRFAETGIFDNKNRKREIILNNQI